MHQSVRHSNALVFSVWLIFPLQNLLTAAVLVVAVAVMWMEDDLRCVIRITSSSRGSGMIEIEILHLPFSSLLTTAFFHQPPTDTLLFSLIFSFFFSEILRNICSSRECFLYKMSHLFILIEYLMNVLLKYYYFHLR